MSFQMARSLVIQLLDPRTDRLHHGLALAATAAAMGRPTTIVLFQGALWALVTGRADQPALEGLGVEVAAALTVGHERHPAPPTRLLRDARGLGARVYACSGSVELAGLALADVLAVVDDVLGLPTILRRAGDDADLVVV
ncbi:MAG: hypothetical protein AMXMBFR64_18630 [Myxococcales bacterium]